MNEHVQAQPSAASFADNPLYIEGQNRGLVLFEPQKGPPNLLESRFDHNESVRVVVFDTLSSNAARGDPAF